MPLNRGICCPQAVVDQLTTCVGSLPADQEPRWTLDEAGGRRSPCRGARPARRHLPPARGRRSRRPARRHRCPASPRLRASARLGSARLGSARLGGARPVMAASVFCCLRWCRDGGAGHIPLKEMPAVQLDTQRMGERSGLCGCEGWRG